jgi:hypothetical protein
LTVLPHQQRAYCDGRNNCANGPYRSHDGTQSTDYRNRRQ